ncbi:phage tail protein [Shewanella algidipiscicola]|uniref:phage tail protein n=1 Tax=Shewanella algidipiscicola TaxID=614070 RepID=UPI000D783135|nr:tail fiber protein [Shewanella algidipiscicola]
MEENYLGEIRMVGFNFAPVGWALCAGQMLSISSHQALYSILGTTYGGDGRTTFQLPDLRGRVPVSFGQSLGTSLYKQGQTLGIEKTNLTTVQLPAHSHALHSNQINASVSPLASTGSGTIDEPGPNTVPAKIASGLSALEAYSTTADTSMQPSPVSFEGNTNTTGNNAPVDLRQPLTVVNFIIALQGLYPPRP